MCVVRDACVHVSFSVARVACDACVCVVNIVCDGVCVNVFCVCVCCVCYVDVCVVYN